jgi:hypothetical protein
MKRFLLPFASFLVITLCTAVPFAQENSTRPDGWRGLVLDVSTPEDAIRILGKPSKDKDKQAFTLVAAREWLGSVEKQKIFRKLTFKKPEGFAQATLFFKDNKLVMIELEGKYEFEEGWLDPDHLFKIFSADFKPHNKIFGGKRLLPPEEFSRVGDPATKDFAYYYDMIAVAERSFILADVNNSEPSAAGLFGANPSYNRDQKDKKRRDAGGKFPGNVEKIQIISRSLTKD